MLFVRKRTEEQHERLVQMWKHRLPLIMADFAVTAKPPARIRSVKLNHLLPESAQRRPGQQVQSSSSSESSSSSDTESNGGPEDPLAPAEEGKEEINSVGVDLSKDSNVVCDAGRRNLGTNPIGRNP